MPTLKDTFGCGSGTGEELTIKEKIAELFKKYNTMHAELREFELCVFWDLVNFK